MIQMPKRSVTRFFIPLIDVLTLLFCIYLLLPIVEAKEGDASEAGEKTGPLSERERRELERLRRLAADPIAAKDRQELERLRRESRGNVQQWLVVRVLEIDADTGKLFYYAPDRVGIDNEAEARTFIQQSRREYGNREVYYLFLYPRRLTGYPEQRQIKRYDSWFADVPHGSDNPIIGR